MTRTSGLANLKRIHRLLAQKLETLNSKPSRMLIKVGKLLTELIASVIVIEKVENVLGVEPMDIVVHIPNISGMEIVLNQC